MGEGVSRLQLEGFFEGGCGLRILLLAEKGERQIELCAGVGRRKGDCLPEMFLRSRDLAGLEERQSKPVPDL